MSKNRPSCGRGLERRLDNEVHNRCPICGGLPLVRAHTTKTYSEVGWSYDYLLSICVECEKKVEAGHINREYLQELKNLFRKSFLNDNGIKPYKISPMFPNDIYLGTNHTASCDIIFAYREVPVIWLENLNNSKTLNARFYDIHGTVITAIDKNSWVANREHFFDIVVVRDGDSLNMEIVGKKDDTNIKLSISDKGIVLQDSIFYLPGIKIEIKQSGDLIINSNVITASSVSNSRIAFNIG